MTLHSDILIQAKSFLLLINVIYLVEKQQIPIL